jgi:hypothetical protein
MATFQFETTDLDFWIARRVTPPRTAGHHVSGVILAMLKSISGKYDNWGQGGDARKPMHEVGYAWEDALAGPLAARAARTTLPSMEISRDGIYGTPDRLTIEDGRIVDEELKATWKSAKGLVGGEGGALPQALQQNMKFAYWLLQAKTYAAILQAYTIDPVSGTALMPLAEWDPEDPPPPHPPALVRIFGLFLMGEYKGEFPIPIAWRIEWTAEELETWWRAIVKFVAENPGKLTPEGE